MLSPKQTLQNELYSALLKQFGQNQAPIYVLFYSLFPKMAITSHFPKALKKFLNEKVEKDAVWKYSLPTIYILTKGIDLMGKRKREKDQCGAHSYFPRFSDYRHRETRKNQQCSRMGCNDAAKHQQTQELGAVHSCYASTLHAALRAPISSSQAFLF